MLVLSQLSSSSLFSSRIPALHLHSSPCLFVSNSCRLIWVPNYTKIPSISAMNMINNTNIIDPQTHPANVVDQEEDAAAAAAAAKDTRKGEEEEKKKGSNEDVLVQYVVLRRDLIDSWPLGSVVTQGCHASVSAIWEHKDDHLTLNYCSSHNIDSMHKVTLEVKGEPQILNLSEKLKAGSIAHKLWMEQPENIPTCLATKPYPKSVVSSFFKKLKLCK